jgi:hypothetical protein
MATYKTKQFINQYTEEEFYEFCRDKIAAADAEVAGYQAELDKLETVATAAAQPQNAWKFRSGAATIQNRKKDEEKAVAIQGLKSKIAAILESVKPSRDLIEHLEALEQMRREYAASVRENTRKARELYVIGPERHYDGYQL